jgi:uncharacterized protein YcnI
VVDQRREQFSVTVTAPGVVAGDSDATIVFRVPDESDTASTVGLKLQLPTDTPIAGLLVAPQHGWTAAITQTKLAKPIQTDDGGDHRSRLRDRLESRPRYRDQARVLRRVHDHRRQTPDGVTTLTFKAIQSYSDGKQVAWIEQPAQGSSAEPEHPAPVLHLPAATGTGPTSAASSVSSAAPTVSATPAATSNKGASKGAATTGIVLGAIGVALGAAALMLTLRRRRPAGHDAT